MSQQDSQHFATRHEQINGRVLSADQARRVDRYAIDELGMAGLVLMENAGRGCVDVLCRQDSLQGVIVICGAGNNGGDGYVIARHLAIREIPVRCIQIAPTDKLPQDAMHNREIARQLQAIEFVDLSAGWSASQFQNSLGPIQGHPPDWIVDALLGTGIKGALRAPYDQIVRQINEMPLKRLAVDLPTGLNCDEGATEATIFQADVTCTFVAMKPGLVAESAASYVGQIHVLDIGVPDEVIAAAVNRQS